MGTIDERAGKIHQIAVDHGFWNFPRNFGEMLALMHSELSEALEEHRAGKPSVYFKCQNCGYESADGSVEGYDDVVSGHPVPKPKVSWWLAAWQSMFSKDCFGDPNPKPEGAAIELIDCNIRVYDTLVDLLTDNEDCSIEDLYNLKMNFNAQREHMHGKAY